MKDARQRISPEFPLRGIDLTSAASARAQILDANVDKFEAVRAATRGPANIVRTAMLSSDAPEALKQSEPQPSEPTDPNRSLVDLANSLAEESSVTRGRLVA